MSYYKTKTIRNLKSATLLDIVQNLEGDLKVKALEVLVVRLGEGKAPHEPALIRQGLPTGYRFKKRYLCNACGKRFAYKSRYNRHVLKEAGQVHSYGK
jgi:hypothetical protein